MSAPQSSLSGYRYTHAELGCSHDYLLPSIQTVLVHLCAELDPSGRRLFDLWCGNSSVAYLLSQYGWDVAGVDPSTEGIAQAHAKYPGLRLAVGSAYDDLAEQYGRFPVVLILEVVELVYLPRLYAATLIDLLVPGGTAIISTPYHGYWKNLALALSGKLDDHFTALWYHGHIKFWSIKTLGSLLTEPGFVNIRFCRIGRVPALAKSMIAVARKPQAT